MGWLKDRIDILKLRYKVWRGGTVGVLIADPVEEKPNWRYVEPKDLHFRCPTCGQAHRMVIDKEARIELSQSKDGEYQIFGRIGDRVHVDPERGFMSFIDAELADTKTVVSCDDCGDSNERWKWHDAYHNAFKWLEMDGDQLCHCGGELIMEPVAPNKYGLQCEKCRWVKPESDFSPGDGVVETLAVTAAKGDDEDGRS